MTTTSTHHAGSRRDEPPNSQIDPATSAPAPMNVHGPSVPACTSIDMPNMPSNNSATAHGATGRCEKPKHAPMSATAPTNPATPTPTEKNSNTISASPTTNRKYATHGASSVCASCAPRPSLRKWTSPLGSRTWRAVQLDDLDRRQLHRAGRGLERAAVEQPDELEQRRRLRGHVLQRRVDLERRCRRSGSDRPGRGARPARPRRSRPSARATPAAPRAPPPDGPTQTVTGTVACGEVVQQRVRRRRRPRPTRPSGTRRPWNATRSASRSDERMSAAFDGIDQPLTCTTSMRPPLTVCAPATAARHEDASDDSAQPPSPTRRRRHRTQPVVARALVRWSNGGGRILLDLPRRHRRRQGRRREDHGHRRAGGHGRPRRSVGARSSRSRASRACRRCSARPRSATTRSISTPASGPGSSPPTPRSSTTS